MKKLLSLALCLLLCVLACAAMADAEYEEGVYRYTVNEATGEATVLGVLKNYAMFRVPDTLGGHPVAAIGDRAFYGNQCVETVSLPASVKVIGQYAFAGCNELESVTMPAVESIGEGAFENSTVHVVKLPNTLVQVGKRAFASCLKLYSIEVPASLTALSEEMFCDSRFLGNVKLNEGVAVLGDKAFCGCGMERIDLPASVTEVGVNPFISCLKLREFHVAAANPVLRAEDGALIDTASASLVSYAIGRKANAYTVPADVQTIGVAAFCQASALCQVTVPDTVAVVSDYAFWYCRSLTEVQVAEGVEVHPTAFAGCYALAQ